MAEVVIRERVNSVEMLWFFVSQVDYFALFKRLWHISADRMLFLASAFTFPECFAFVMSFRGLKSVLLKMILTLFPF